MTVRHIPLILITLALCTAHVRSALASSFSGEVPVNSNSSAANSQPAPISAVATNASMLIGTRWILFSANDSMGGTIASLQPSPYYGALELSFADRRISVSGGCNRFAAPYRYEADRMDVGEMMQTTMKCGDTKLKAIDDAIATYLKGALKVGFIDDARIPDQKFMQFLLSDGTRLKLYAVTESTSGDDYASVLFEVASQEEPCAQPMLPSLGSCLRVREVRYNENNLLEAEGEWWPYPYAIRGYRHIAGQRNVLRLKQFNIPAPPIHGPTSILELDMVLASEMLEQ